MELVCVNLRCALTRLQVRIVFTSSTQLNTFCYKSKERTGLNDVMQVRTEIARLAIHSACK